MREGAGEAVQGDTGPASDWVLRHLALMRPGGEVLDLACGSGRHLAVGLASGRRLVGVDRDLSRIRCGPKDGRLELIEADLEDGSPWPLGMRTFDGVIVTNYLWRPIAPAIVAAVARDGVLIYETFAVGQERFGRPRNPEFLLQDMELIDWVRPRLHIVAFQKQRLCHPERIVQRIVAVGPDHPYRTGDNWLGCS